MGTLYFSKDHEYILVDGATGVVGITDYAQSQLGDVVYVELPEEGTKLDQQDEACVVESVKVASEIYAPVSGEIIAANDSLDDNPALVNEDPMEDGWIFKIKLEDAGELDELMDEDQYQEYVDGLS